MLAVPIEKKKVKLNDNLNYNNQQLQFMGGRTTYTKKKTTLSLSLSPNFFFRYSEATIKPHFFHHNHNLQQLPSTKKHLQDIYGSIPAQIWQVRILGTPGIAFWSILVIENTVCRKKMTILLGPAHKRFLRDMAWDPVLHVNVVNKLLQHRLHVEQLMKFSYNLVRLCP